MFTFSKKEFSEELRVVEKVPSTNEYRRQFYPEDYYIIAESNPNIYEIIENMDNLKKIEFEINFDNKLKDHPWSVNEDYFKNKISKRSIFKQGMEKINKRFLRVKKLLYGIFDSNENDDFSITSFSIEINCSNEILAVLLNHNILIMYNVFRNEFYPFNLKLSNEVMEPSKVKKVIWNKYKVNEISVLYNDYLAQFEFVDNYLHLSSLKRYENIVDLRSDPNGRYEIVIYDSGRSIAILDINRINIYSKTFLGKNFSSIEWSSDSTFFIAITHNSLYLFNMFDLSVKQWSNFRNNIKAVAINNENNFIFVFVENQDNFIYVVYEGSNNIYDLRAYSGYNNISNHYLHEHYKFHSKIYNLLIEEEFVVSKTAVNKDFDRLIVLFSNSKVTSEKILKVYKIENNKSLHDIKFLPSFELSNYKKLLLRDFIYVNDTVSRTEFIYLLWGDGIVTKTFLRFYPN